MRRLGVHDEIDGPSSRQAVLGFLRARFADQFVLDQFVDEIGDRHFRQSRLFGKADAGGAVIQDQVSE